MAYVYIYYDPRKTPLEPIYVGKGKNERFLDHINYINKLYKKKCRLNYI